MAMTWCLPLLLAVALTAAAALAAPARQPQAAVSARPLFDRSQPSALADLVDPLRPRAHGRHKPLGPHRKLAVGGQAADEGTTSQPPTPDPYRLPTSLRPTTYTIFLTPKLYGDPFTFSGQIEIRFNAIEATDKIVLHSKELTYDNLAENCVVLLDNEDQDRWADVGNLEFKPEMETATFHLSKALVAGGRYILRIMSYTGILNDDMDGFYRSSYKTSNGETRWLATTQFEPTGARRAFPCWDEPSYKSRYQIIMKHYPDQSAISNMPFDKVQPLEDGSVLTTFKPTLPMSSYLVAFIVSEFGELKSAQGNFSTWARQDILAGGAFAQEIGPQALKLLSEFNGVNYILPKMDQAAIPDFAAGAMENWGLVTYREQRLIETDTTTTAMVESIATAICHEFGHQWTGDLVTLDWWSHTWLNEGFATFYENMICAQIKPDWNLEDKMLPAFYHVAMESDVRETQVAMSSPVTKFSEIDERFGVISYDKGGSVIRMLYYALTPNAFMMGMRRYLSVNMFKNTNPELLFHSLGAEVDHSGMNPLALGTSLSEVASTWTEQPGVPVLTASRDYSGAEDAGRVVFTQERFLYAPAQDPSSVAQKWWIPLVVTTQVWPGPDFSTTLPQGWLSPHVSYTVIHTSAKAHQWVLVDPAQTGYFRVNYDTENWQMLAAAMTATPSVFPAAARARLLNDALALARGGRLDYSLALPFLGAYKAERSVAAWQTASAAIKYLLARMYNTDALADFLSVVQDITAGAYAEVGYRATNADTHEQAYLRYIVASFACHSGNARCLADAAAALKAWIADPAKNTLQADTRATSLCYGVRGSDAATFEAMRKMWQAATGDIREIYLGALSCTADKSLLKSMLDDTLARKYSTKDGISIFNAVYDKLDNHALLMGFVKANADAMADVFQSDFDVQVLNGLIRDIRSRTELLEVRQWVEAKYTKLPGALSDAFQSAENDLQSWYDKYFVIVSTWLKNYTPSPTPAPGSSTTPDPGCSTTPASGSSTTPASGGSTTPASGGSTTPASGGSTTPASGGSTTPASGGSTTPASGGSTTPASGCSTTPPSGGSTTPASGGSTTPSGASVMTASVAVLIAALSVALRI